MRPALICFAACLALSYADGARILGLFPHTGKSHQMVFEPLLKTLAERGHHVTVASFFPLADPPANYTDISFQGIANVGLETIDLNLFENPSLLLRTPYLGKFVMRLMEFHPLAGMALNVCQKAVNWPPLVAALKKEYDLVIVENFNSDCMLGLLHVYNVRAPVVALMSSAMLPWSAYRIGVTDNPAYVPVTCLPFSTQMTFPERVTNTFFNYFYKWWFRYEIQVKEQVIIEKQYGRKIPDLEDLSKNMSLLLVNTFHPLNGAKPLVPGVVEVGGMHLGSIRKPIPQYIEKFINESEHGVILFSFGSLIKTATMPKYKEEMFINVLSKLKQRVIWKFEDSDEEGTIIGNGRILRVKWIPQYELLQHKQVVAFLAHGGLLGMTEAVSAGKPMLVVPFFGDQPTNAAAATAAGFAKYIPYLELTEDALENGLKSVLSAEMRLNARRLSKIWQDRQSSPLETAVYWVERVIRWGPASPLHTAARELSFFEHALLDVAATLIGIVLFAICAIWLALSRISRIFTRSSKEKMH
ncbi:UDP-glucosyltransferase 2-like [Epargyreus clarus]|uniref:UDP-glucosyltransferase 2-like n=1 Tax=Epargyreus clarus TaxID=520877 RepID=UPI003C2F6756